MYNTYKKLSQEELQREKLALIKSIEQARKFGQDTRNLREAYTMVSSLLK